jgi:hypothetical protein
VAGSENLDPPEQGEGFMTRDIALVLILASLGSSCAPSSSAPIAGSGAQTVKVSGDTISIGAVNIRGQSTLPLRSQSDSTIVTNGSDTFYLSKLSGGGYLLVYRYSPPNPLITSDPYPHLTVQGQSAIYSRVTSTAPYFAQQKIQPPYTFDAPFRQLKWPALLFNRGAGIFLLAESPLFEEAIEPFVSAYPVIRSIPEADDTTAIQFSQNPSRPSQQINLGWKQIDHSQTTRTYVAPVSDSNITAIALSMGNPAAAKRVWYLASGTWQKANTESGSAHDPNLLLMHTDRPTELLVETSAGPPSTHAAAYFGSVGYIQRSRWAAFALYQERGDQSFFDRSMIPAMAEYEHEMFSLRDGAAPPTFSETWRALLQLDAFTNGKNLLNPKFFSTGFPEAADPSYGLDPSLNISVSWVSDEAALQAAMGAQLFGFSIDPRYAQGVKAFYDPSKSFYWGAYLRSTAKFVSADTGGDGVVIGYNYLLSLTRLTELIGTPVGLPASAVQTLVDRVLPILQPGYVAGYPQIPYLWQYPQLSGLQWEYGMGKELSEAQLSYICGLWWIRTQDQRYRDCQIRSLDFPESFPLRLRGSNFLWGLDVVHGGYVLDALLLAFKTTNDRRYLDSAIDGWRYELLFLFSTQNYPETPFDDRSAAVTSYYSTFANLNRGNYWRDDSWNNSRTLWSLSKLLAYTDDPAIVWQLSVARQTHKQSYPLVDAVYSPSQTSDYYGTPIDLADQALGWEDLANHYSTQIAFSTDIWREAAIFESLEAKGAAVYRIPGASLDDPGMAFVVGQPSQDVALTIDALDIRFGDGTKTSTVHLDKNGIARVALVRSPVS